MMIQDQEKPLKELVTVFLEENKKLNLSAFRDEESCWNGNVLDSVVGCDLDVIKEASSILDLGTGGGFPLLPLALCLPKASFTGLDATQKKIDAIRSIAEQMKLNNVQFECGRAEELGRDVKHREHYDLVTARAVAPLNTLIEYAAPFLKVGGHLIAWKSLNIEQELHDSLLARAELSCELIDKYEYELPGDWGKRQLLIFVKRAATHKKYPRENGVPKKEPIK